MVGGARGLLQLHAGKAELPLPDRVSNTRARDQCTDSYTLYSENSSKRKQTTQRGFLDDAEKAMANVEQVSTLQT